MSELPYTYDTAAQTVTVLPPELFHRPLPRDCMAAALNTICFARDTTATLQDELEYDALLNGMQPAVNNFYLRLKEWQYAHRGNGAVGHLVLRRVPTEAVFRLYMAMVAVAVDWFTVESGVDAALRPVELRLVLDPVHQQTLEVVVTALAMRHDPVASLAAMRRIIELIQQQSSL